MAGAAAGRNGGFLIAGPEAAMHEALTAWGTTAIDLYRETLAEIDTLEATPAARRVAADGVGPAGRAAR